MDFQKHVQVTVKYVKIVKTKQMKNWKKNKEKQKM